MRTNRYPSRQIFRERTMLLHILYLVGITAEAMTGALAAGRRRMDTFGVIMLALVGNTPKVMSLLEMLKHYLEEV